MTWYEDVDRRLDDLDRKVDQLQRVIANMITESLGITGPVPAGQPPERSVSSVTPRDDDEPGDLDLPPDFVSAECTHQHQALVAGNIVCAKCGHVLQRKTGVVPPNTPVENLPDWARSAAQGGPDA